MTAGERERARQGASKLKGYVKEAAKDFVIVCRHPVYVCVVGGQTFYTGALVNFRLTERIISAGILYFLSCTSEANNHL